MQIRPALRSHMRLLALFRLALGSVQTVCAVLAATIAPACGSTSKNPPGAAGGAGFSNATAAPTTSSGSGATSAASGANGGSTTGAGGVDATGGTAGMGSVNEVCANPVNWTDEADVGVYRCGSEIVWRHEVVACPRGATRSQPVDLPSDLDPSLLGTDDCAHDDDCGEQQICRLIFYFEDPCMGGDPETVVSVDRVCEQHCQADDDCPENMLCLCDETGTGLNTCVSSVPADAPGACRGDADCREGSRCLGGSPGGFVCEDARDECYENSDCDPGTFCALTIDNETGEYIRTCVEDLGACVLG